MRHSKALIWAGVAGAVLAATGPALAAPSLDVTDAVARLTVIPEARPDIEVEILAANPNLPLRVRRDGERVIIDGGLGRGKIKSCRRTGAGEFSAVVDGLGEVGRRQMPHVVVRMPRDIALRAGGAVHGVVGRSASLDLGSAGCGDWLIANVAGDLRISQAGSGDTRAGSARAARLRVTGEGDIAMASVTHGLTAEIAGAGDITVASLLGGPLVARIAGSGNIRVREGRAGPMTAGVAGSGNIEFGGRADSLKARINGAGDIHVEAVRGTASKAIMGKGRVLIGP